MEVVEVAVRELLTATVPPLPKRLSGYSTGELGKTRGRRHASVFSSSTKLCVSGARRWVRLVTGLPRHEASGLEIVVSELVTNALDHSASGEPGGLVTVRIAFLDVSRIRIAVTDSGPKVFGGPGFPDWSGDSPDPEHGRGLTLVQAFSRRTGVIGVRGEPLTVWAVIDRSDLRRR